MGGSPSTRGSAPAGGSVRTELNPIDIRELLLLENAASHPLTSFSSEAMEARGQPVCPTPAASLWLHARTHQSPHLHPRLKVALVLLFSQPSCLHFLPPFCIQDGSQNRHFPATLLSFRTKFFWTAAADLGDKKLEGGVANPKAAAASWTQPEPFMAD